MERAGLLGGTRSKEDEESLFRYSGSMEWQTGGGGGEKLENE